MRAVCQDVSALIEVLPTADPDRSGAQLSFLEDADLDACKAWASSVIRALPTLADMEASDGAA